MTIRPRTMAVVAVAAALLGAVWLLRRPRALTAEERIEKTFRDAAHAAEQRKVDQVVAVLSDRFQGGGGDGMRASRDEVRRLLAFELLRGQWVSVAISSSRVIVDGKRARASVDALLSRAQDRKKGLGSLLPGEASVHRFQLELEEEEPGTWRVVSGGWRQVGLEEALSGPEAPHW